MTKKRSLTYIVYGLIALAVLVVPGLFRLLTDWYWFQATGFQNIFTTILGTKILLGLSVGIFSFLAIYGNLWLANRLIVSKPLVIRLGQGKVSQLDMADHIRRFALPVSLMLGFFTGLVGAGSWETVLQHINASPFGATDPIFNRDISFYFFNLPFIRALVGVGFWLLGVSLIGAAVSYALRGGLSFGAVQYSFGGGNVLKSLRIEKPAKIHLSILIVPLFLLTAFNIYAVRIPSLLYNSTGPFTGASFTDINAVLPFLKILIVVAVVAALLAAMNAFKANNRLIVLAFGSYILVSVFGGLVYPMILQRFVVLPNELVKETPFIEHNIAATRKAFALDEIEERDLAGEATLTMEDINDNRSTIKNIRLWDREPLLDTFGQLQEIRTYYDFVSIDNDRYRLDGDYRQVLLSPRELNTSSLPQRNFINDRLTFTHGFGLTLSPVNEVTPEGLPVLFVKDLPPVSSVESLAINRPEIYYGELVSDWVAVKTKAQEFNYPSGEANVFTNYEGAGGVPVESFFRKALFALRFGSLKILLSNDITKDSRIMYYRNIKERVRRVVPFFEPG